MLSAIDVELNVSLKFTQKKRSAIESSHLLTPNRSRGKCWKLIRISTKCQSFLHDNLFNLILTGAFHTKDTTWALTMSPRRKEESISTLSISVALTSWSLLIEVAYKQNNILKTEQQTSLDKLQSEYARDKCDAYVVIIQKEYHIPNYATKFFSHGLRAKTQNISRSHPFHHFGNLP